MPKLDRKTEDALVDAAVRARLRAYAPYSRFLVGAALLTRAGDVVEGCNVENASYGLCICAERTAISAAVASGLLAPGGLRAMAIVTATTPPSSPCGMCRQVLAEFAGSGDADLVLARPPPNLGTRRLRTTVKKLLPGSFNGAMLRKGTGR